MNIVVVDDNAMLGQLVVRKTALWGYLGTTRIVPVPGDSAEDVAERVMEYEPEVVVLDHDFELEFSGADVARELRRVGFDGELVVFSSLRASAQQAVFGSYRISAYVVKPETNELRGPLGQIAQSIAKAGD